MKFVNEKPGEFSFRESNNYEVVYDSERDVYGLLVDGTLFTFLNKSQAITLKDTFKHPKFEEFFNSVGIGKENLNLQPKAACKDDYERPTGEIVFEAVKASKGAFLYKDVTKVSKLGEQVIVFTKKGNFKISENRSKILVKKVTNYQGAMMKVKLHEALKNLIKEAGYANDERYSHAPEKLELKKIRYLFNHIEDLSRYFYDNPGFTSCSQCGQLAWAVSQGGEKGFEEGFLPSSAGPIEAAVDTVYGFTDLIDPKDTITLYRGIELVGDSEPDLKHPGICWSYSREMAEEFVSQFDDDDDPNSAPCIITCETTLDNVDWLMSILLLTDTPEEGEIRIWDDSKVKIKDCEVL